MDISLSPFKDNVSVIETGLNVKHLRNDVERACRCISYLDAGHEARNLASAVLATWAGSCQITAFYDNEINKLLGVDWTS